MTTNETEVKKAAANVPETEQDKLRIEVEPEEFPGTTTNFITTGTNLGEIICELFSGVFSDFAGCNVTIDEVKRINFPEIRRVFVYFEDRGNARPGTIKNLYRIGTDQRTGEMSRTSRGINMLREKGKNRSFDLNDETKEYLEEFLPLDNNRKPVKWEKVIRQRTEPTPAGRVRAYIEVELDIFSVLKKIWGNKIIKNSGKTRVDYIATTIKPIYSNTMAMTNQYNQLGMPITNGYRTPIDYIISISQLNCNEIDKTINAAGLNMPQGNAIPMVHVKP